MSATAAGQPPTLDELRARRDEILEVASRHGVSNIRVFGSVARGEARRGSDVDFLVDIEKGRSLFDLGGFYADLEDLLGCAIDLGTDVKPRLREHIEAEAVPL
jgi:predicted nucleotidyltransferase